MIFGKGKNAVISAHVVAEILGYLTRERRIKIGKKLYEAAIKAKENDPILITHIQKRSKQIYLYIFTKETRQNRQNYLKAVAIAAQKKYGYDKVFSVVSEPSGTGGRSYDFFILKENILSSITDIPQFVLNQLPELNGDLFE